MAFFEPGLSLELIDGFKHSFGTYTMCAVRVCEVTCKIDLVWLNFLEKFYDDVDVSLCAFSLLDSACLVERKVQEVTVCLVIETERAYCTLGLGTSYGSLEVQQCSWFRLSRLL